MPSYCLRLFGAPWIERDAQPVTIQRRKAMALLAYLAVSARAHTRESLATLLWPESDQSAALANLRRELSELKSALDAELLLVERVNISLNPASDVWLDVAEFRDRIAKVQAHNHDSGQSCPECFAHLSEALALYTGDFMAGFNLPDSPEFDNWQFFQSDGLRQALAEGLQKLIQYHSDKGELCFQKRVMKPCVTAMLITPGELASAVWLMPEKWVTSSARPGPFGSWGKSIA